MNDYEFIELWIRLSAINQFTIQYNLLVLLFFFIIVSICSDDNATKCLSVHG